MKTLRKLAARCLLAAVGVAAARPLLELMQVPDAILTLASLYLRIYFLGMPATMLYNFGAALLRSIGDTRRPLYYLTAAGVVNVALNLLLVIVFQLDVAGVAIATVISQCLSALLVVRCLMHEQSDIREQTGSKQGKSDSEIGRFGCKVCRCICIAGICGRYDVVPRKHRSRSQQDGSGSKQGYRSKS